MKNALQIFGGVCGAVVGFVATLLALELFGFGNRADPIMSGILALVVFAPAGAVTGLVLGTIIAMRLRGRNHSGGLVANSLRALAVIVVLSATGGAIYFWYALATATPWLNPNAATPVLQFEIRLPAGGVPPASVRDIAIELQTDRVYPLGLTDKAPHGSALGPWQPHGDGSEIRYRAKWPGRD